MSETLNIERGVKQGDALSCAIFIIFIDPLIRNLNKSDQIEKIVVKKTNNPDVIGFKAAAYADDISVICKKNQILIQQVFKEYERLTKKAGLELNADKTEIIILNSEITENISFYYLNNRVSVQTVEKMKICGLYYATDLNEEYRLNVLEKIDKLSTKIKIWTGRNLTMEGKNLIVKTFGLSQLIYNMQSFGFEKSELKTIEQIIFKFLWSTKDNQNGVDRIKRSIMKNEYEEGGINVTDIESLDRSLKLKQFIRASNSLHPIAKIQNMVTNGKKLQQEYFNITTEEAISASAQDTINIITDSSRKDYEALEKEEYESDRNLIEEIMSINIETFLLRKRRPLQACLAKLLRKNGISCLGQAVQRQEYERNRNIVEMIETTLGAVSPTLIKIARCAQYDAEDSLEDIGIRSLQLEPTNRKDVTSITTKELQKCLKRNMKKLESLDVKRKLEIDHFEKNEITRVRQNCPNAKLRNIYFRLIHNDFFTRTKMKKYNMVDSDECERCKKPETIKHLLWECPHVKIIWNTYNQLMLLTSNVEDTVKSYQEIYQSCNKSSTNILKLQTVKSLIQIIRPKNWTEDNVHVMYKEIIDIERYNYKSRRKEDKFNTKWSHILNTLNLIKCS